MEIVKRVIKLCEDNNVSGVELGRKLGLKKSPITDWKNQKSKPTLEQIIAICDIFAITSDYLLFGKTSDSILKTKNSECIFENNFDNQISVDEHNLLQTYRDIDDIGKNQVQDYLKEIWAEHRIPKNKLSGSLIENTSNTTA